jgi:hypothetical protein
MTDGKDRFDDKFTFTPDQMKVVSVPSDLAKRDAEIIAEYNRKHQAKEDEKSK